MLSGEKRNGNLQNLMDTMTKQQEIDYLDRIIKTCGPQSYIGPWLKESRSAIVRAITEDLPVGVYLKSPRIGYHEYD